MLAHASHIRVSTAVTGLLMFDLEHYSIVGPPRGYSPRHDAKGFHDSSLLTCSKTFVP